MLTHSPLPSWSSLFSAVVDEPSTESALSEPWKRTGETAGWLSRSAWSLALIAQWRQALCGKTPIRVWVPDYFCNASLIPLRGTGVKLVFYRVDADRNPDLDSCRELAVSDPPDVFVLVHYFGRPANTAPSRDFCVRNGCWLVEDAAQVLRPVTGVGDYGDFVLYSPHKHLPLPDGAVLIARSGGAAKLGKGDLAALGAPKSWAAQLQALDSQLRIKRKLGTVSELAWLSKRFIQKLGGGGRRQPHSPYEEKFATPVISLFPLSAPPQTDLSRRLLSASVNDLDAVAQERDRNQKLWDALLLTEGDSRPVIGDARPAASMWTPYLSAFRAEGSNAALVFRDWQENGLPVSTWPDIPPEVAGDIAIHRVAWSLRHERVYLPVHQTLGDAPFEAVRRFSPRARAQVAALTERDSVSREEWEGWVGSAQRSNLLQSWAYGEAKRRTSGWRVTRRAFESEGRTVAIVQILQRSFAGFRLTRINRGPLFLGGASEADRNYVWRAVANFGNLRTGKILSISPGLELSGSTLLLMKDLGFRRRGPGSYQSAWLDLGTSEAELRQRLDAKWRNKLKLSEGEGLDVKVDETKEGFDWMMSRYAELKAERGFAGPAVALIESLRNNSGEGSGAIVFQALSQGEPCAGLCVFTHGRDATYLLGWNGEEGRRRRANQLLLWSAIRELRRRGVAALDLGGFSERDTPGVRTFKLGLNGARYELVGEQVKW